MNPNIHSVVLRHAAWLATRMGRSRGRIFLNLLAVCFVLMLVVLGMMLGLNLLFAEITLFGIHAIFQLLHAVLPGVRR